MRLALVDRSFSSIHPLPSLKARGALWWMAFLMAMAVAMPTAHAGVCGLCPTNKARGTIPGHLTDSQGLDRSQSIHAPIPEIMGTSHGQVDFSRPMTEKAFNIWVPTGPEPSISDQIPTLAGLHRTAGRTVRISPTRNGMPTCNDWRIRTVRPAV